VGLQISIRESADVTILDLRGRSTIDGGESELLNSRLKQLVANDHSIQGMEELRSTGTGKVKHQIIAVTCSIDHAKSVHALYEERNYRADVIHSNLSEEELLRVRTDLEQGRLDAIVQVQMLAEGADYPSLGVAAIFRPYRHLVPYVQFVGDVMRVTKLCIAEEDTITKNLYIASIKVLRGTNKDMPPELAGAIATCFSTGPDYQSAVRSAVTALRQMGFEFTDIVGPVREIPLEQWDRYIASTWPEASATLPRQSDLPQILERGGVFFGPFAGFER
jgi:Helicase conserved C-terminal domain